MMYNTTPAFRMVEAHALCRSKTDRLMADAYADYHFANVIADTLQFAKNKQLMSSDHISIIQHFFDFRNPFL